LAFFSAPRLRGAPLVVVLDRFDGQPLRGPRPLAMGGNERRRTIQHHESRA